MQHSWREFASENAGPRQHWRCGVSDYSRNWY